LDIVVLSALVIAAAWPKGLTEPDGLLRFAFGTILGWCMLCCWTHGLAEEARLAVVHFRQDSESRYPATPVAGLVGNEESLLTDDPWVAVARGQRTVVLDAVSLARTVRTDPQSARALVRRIEAREFAKVVLGSLPAQSTELDDVYFGRPITAAIR